MAYFCTLVISRFQSRFYYLGCSTVGLCIMNSFFRHKGIHKYTWYRNSVDSVLSLTSVLSQLICFLLWLMFMLKEEMNCLPIITSCLHSKKPEPSENKETIQSIKSIQNKLGVTSRQKGETHFCQQSCFPV